MDQLLYFLNSLSPQGIFIIVISIITIGLFAIVLFKHQWVDNRQIIVYITPHQLQAPDHEPKDHIGCAIRSLLYFVLCICVLGLILSTFTFFIPPTPVEQAKTLIQNYYNDLNQKNYQTAYSLIEHCSQSYNQFIDNFKYTEHSDFSFNNIEQSSDGTIDITVTVKAKEKNPSTGQQVNTYIFIYTIGQVHNAYKILKGYSLPGHSYPVPFC